MNERLRKAVHIFFGLPILLIPLIPWWSLLAIASLALLHNIFLMPLYAKRIMRKGFDKGVVYYPLAVLLLLVLLKNNLALAAGAWALLSFADGLASLAGGKHTLPWNPKKTFTGTGAFLISGFLFVPLAYWYVAGSLNLKNILALEGAVFLSGLFESLDLGFDDNLIAPSSFVVFFFSLQRASLHIGRLEFVFAAVVLLLFFLAIFFGFFDLQGSLSAAAVGLGMVFFGGWKIFLLLLTFLLLSEASSLYRAREKGGFRRGASSVWGKGGPALLFSFLGLPQAAVVALAEATFDTVATEIGKLSRGAGINVRTFRHGSPGEEGIWTLKGTLWGAVASLGLLLAVRFLKIPLNLPLALGVVLLCNLAEAHFKPCTTHSFANFLTCLLAASSYVLLASFLKFWG